MKRIIKLTFLFITLLSGVNIFGSETTIKIKSIQNLEPSYLDSIIIYNTSNNTTLRVGDLSHSTTEYQLNLNEGKVLLSTNINAVVNSPVFNISQINNTLEINTNLKNPTPLHANLYSLDGRLVCSQSIMAYAGENNIQLKIQPENVYVLKVSTNHYSRAFKLKTNHFGNTTTGQLIVKSGMKMKSVSANTFSYSEGDRIKIIVKKGNIQSPDWQGNPKNGMNVLIALPKKDKAFDMKQTLSTGAQTNTISYSGVAFYTGCYHASSFYPPGKVADYFGFQYMRDNDPDESGHNTDFLTKAAYHMLHILDEDQIQDLVDLALLQQPIINDYAMARLPIIKAFHRYLDGDIPLGKTTLSIDSIKEASRKLYIIDGEISYGRAQYFSKVIKSMTEAQKDSLYKLGAVGMRTWTMPEKPKNKFPKDLNTLVMTNASEMFSWFLGSIEADVYFCPERQGTYFGGFFMKDAPAMGNPDYSIDTETTANKGAYMIKSILDNDQSKEIKNIYTMVTPSLNGMVEVREKISIELRRFMEQDAIDKDAVLEWSGEYGELDGTYIFSMADQFVKVGNTLTSAQKDSLMALRDLEDFPCKDGMVYLYSKEVEAPEIEDTDKFFE